MCGLCSQRRLRRRCAGTVERLRPDGLDQTSARRPAAICSKQRLGNFSKQKLGKFLEFWKFPERPGPVPQGFENQAETPRRSSAWPQTGLLARWARVPGVCVCVCVCLAHLGGGAEGVGGLFRGGREREGGKGGEIETGRQSRAFPPPLSRVTDGRVTDGRVTDGLVFASRRRPAVVGPRPASAAAPPPLVGHTTGARDPARCHSRRAARPGPAPALPRRAGNRAEGRTGPRLELGGPGCGIGGVGGRVGRDPPPPPPCAERMRRPPHRRRPDEGAGRRSREPPPSQNPHFSHKGDRPRRPATSRVFVSFTILAAAALDQPAEQRAASPASLDPSRPDAERSGPAPTYGPWTLGRFAPSLHSQAPPNPGPAAGASAQSLRTILARRRRRIPARGLPD